MAESKFISQPEEYTRLIKAGVLLRREGVGVRQERCGGQAGRVWGLGREDVVVRGSGGRGNGLGVRGQGREDFGVRCQGLWVRFEKGARSSGLRSTRAS